MKSINQLLRPFCRRNKICVHCFRRWAARGARCGKCYNSDLLFQRNRYKRRKREGVCVKCGKQPAQATNVRCVNCQEKHSKHKQKKRAAQKRRPSAKTI